MGIFLDGIDVSSGQNGAVAPGDTISNSSRILANCKIALSANQTYANAANDVVNYDTFVFNNGGFSLSAIGTGNDIVFPNGYAGRPIRIYTYLIYAANTTSFRSGQIYLVSSTPTTITRADTTFQAPTTGVGTVFNRLVYTVPDDGSFFRVTAQQLSGGNLDLLRYHPDITTGSGTFAYVEILNG